MSDRMTAEMALISWRREAEATDGFTISELQLPYGAWEALVTERREAGTLSDRDAEWLYAWSMYDLAVSPMADFDRAQRRLGHRLGFRDAERMA